MKVEIVREHFRLADVGYYYVKPGMYRILAPIEKELNTLVECYTTGIRSQRGIIVHFAHLENGRTVHRTTTLYRNDTNEFYARIRDLSYKKGDMVVKYTDNSCDQSMVKKGVLVSNSYQSSIDGMLHCNLRWGDIFVDLPQYLFDKVDDNMSSEYMEKENAKCLLENSLFHLFQKLLNKNKRVVRYMGFRHKRRDGMIYVYVAEGGSGNNRYYVRENELSVETNNE